MGTVSLEGLKSYIQSQGGIVTSQQIVRHFQPFLKDPSNKDRNKELFKSYLSTLTDYRHEEGSNVRILELKKVYQQDGNLEGVPAKENTPRNDGNKPGFKDQLQPMREAQNRHQLREVSRGVSRDTPRDAGDPRQQKKVNYRAVIPKEFGRDESSEITLSCDVQTDGADYVSRGSLSHTNATRDPKPLDNLSRDPVPRDPVPRDPVTRDPVPRDPVPREQVPREPVPRDAARRSHSSPRSSPRSFNKTAEERRSPIVQRQSRDLGNHSNTVGDQSPVRSASKTTDPIRRRVGVIAGERADNLGKDTYNHDDAQESVAAGATKAEQPVIRRASINAINMFNRTAQQKKPPPLKIQETVCEEETESSKADTLDSVADQTEELREEKNILEQTVQSRPEESGSLSFSHHYNSQLDRSNGHVESIGHLGNIRDLTSLLKDKIAIRKTSLVESGCSNVPLEQSEKEWIVKSALGDCDTISRLLLTDRNLVMYRDFISGYTGLHWSCKLGRIDMGRVLIDAGSDVNSRSHSGQTPLHLAAQTGKGELVDLLLHNGADKDLRDHKGRKPGHYLPHNASPETKSLLTLPQPPVNLATNPALRKFSKALSIGDMNDNSPKRAQTMHQAWKKYKHSFVGKKKRGETLKIEPMKRESIATTRVEASKEKCRSHTMPTSKPASVYF